MEDFNIQYSKQAHGSANLPCESGQIAALNAMYLSRPSYTNKISQAMQVALF
ncbi:hypothetical protein PLUTE_a2876 [Pseudoalteromonas luteoviolacea DSM 6061]|nr:hypothetical protein [Pseudoalteromonas luteoviolacea DSM 6061]